MISNTVVRAAYIGSHGWNLEQNYQPNRTPNTCIRYVTIGQPLPTGNFGALGAVEVYGLQYPIMDCRTGQCIRGYLYDNGYIPANRINSVGANGKPNGVMGVPSSYKPASIAVIATPATPITPGG